MSAVVIIPAYKPDETVVTITDQLWAYGCRMVMEELRWKDEKGFYCT